VHLLGISTLSQRGDRKLRMAEASSVAILGCYSIGRDPWHLIELRLRNVCEPIDFGAFILPLPGAQECDWQVPWDERLLDDSGEKQLADDVSLRRGPEILYGNPRLCFFMYLCSNEDLRTPFGSVRLPESTERPSRLNFVQFEEPC
jgi:hypothetical protein